MPVMTLVPPGLVLQSNSGFNPVSRGGGVDWIALIFLAVCLAVALGSVALFIALLLRKRKPTRRDRD